MTNTMTIFRRELASYFNSPIAYIFIIVFLVLNCGLFMAAFFLQGQADMRGFFGNLPLFLIFFIPALTMRLWAEDRRRGTSICIRSCIRSRSRCRGRAPSGPGSSRR